MAVISLFAVFISNSAMVHVILVILLGTVDEQGNGRSFIHYADDDKKWVKYDEVYKMVPITSKSCKSETHKGN